MDSFLPLKHIPACVWDVQYTCNKSNPHFSLKLVLLSIWDIEHEVAAEENSQPSYDLQYPLQIFLLNYIILKSYIAQLIPVYICSLFPVLPAVLFCIFFFFAFPVWIYRSFWDYLLARTGFVSPGLLLIFCLLRFLPHGTQETGTMRKDWWMQPSSSSPHQHKLGWGVEHWVKITPSWYFLFFFLFFS